MTIVCPNCQTELVPNLGGPPGTLSCPNLCVAGFVPPGPMVLVEESLNAHFGLPMAGDDRLPRVHDEAVREEMPMTSDGAKPMVATPKVEAAVAAPKPAQSPKNPDNVPPIPATPPTLASPGRTEVPTPAASDPAGSPQVTPKITKK